MEVAWDTSGDGGGGSGDRDDGGHVGAVDTCNIFKNC